MKIKVEKAELETYGEENKEKDSDDIDYSEVIETARVFLKKLTLKDFIIILLMLMMFMMYVVVNRDIASCNNHYQNLLQNNNYYQNFMQNITQVTTKLW